jgi:general secretion pathway protein L
LKGGKPAARLWVLAPPHRALAATARLSDATVVGYVAIDGDGQARSGEVSIALLPRAQRLDLVFDAGDVFQTEVAAPRLSEAKLRLALPHLIEDRLLAEPSQCHIAYLPPARGGQRPAALPVAAIDRGLLTLLLDVLAGAGERPRAAYSAIYLLPLPSAEALPVYAARGRLTVRTGRHEGVACDLDEAGAPPAALRLALRSAGSQRVRAYGPQAQRLLAMSEALGVPVELAAQPLDASASEQAINLLQGSFARGGVVESSRRRASWRALRAPLLWAAVAAAVYIAGMNGYWLKLDAEAADLRQRMAAAFRGAFPDAELVDPILQTQRELARLRARAGQSSPDDFTALNAQAALLLAGAPVGIVAAVEYRDGTLRLKFKSPPDAALQNQLRAQAVQQGLQVRFDPDGTAHLAVSGG